MGRTYDARLRIDSSTQGVDRYHVRALRVPGAVLAPVGDGHIGPRVVERAGGLENLHGSRRTCVVA